MAFDPSILNDPTQLAPLYSLDSTQAGDRLQLLQDALAYVQANPNLPNADYLLSELNGDISAEKAVTGYDAAQSGVDTASSQFNNMNRIVQAIQNGQGGNLNTVTTGDWNSLGQALGSQTINLKSILNLPQDYILPVGQAIALMQQINPGKLYMIGDQLNSSGALNGMTTTLSNALNDANSTFTKAGTSLVDAFRLPSPDTMTARNALMDYYHNPTTGQIALSTQPAINDIYQRDYNLRNNINTTAAAMNATASGMRKKALDTANNEAVRQAVQVKSNAENQAAQAVNQFDKNVQSQNLAASDLTNQIISGGAANIFSDANKAALLNYGQNANAQEQGYLTSGEQQIQQQQADDSFWSQLAGTVGSGLSKFAGALI